MISTFFGLSARTDATHASIILADALAVLSRKVTILRVTGPGEARLPPTFIPWDDLTLIERVASDPADISEPVSDAIAATSSVDCDLVMDLPAWCISDHDVRARAGIPVLTVGPSPIGEYGAASFMASLDEASKDAGGIACPPWLLGCGHGAGAGNFARDISIKVAGLGGREPCRVLPTVLPPLSRRDAVRLADGDRTSRTLQAGLALAAALQSVAANPSARQADMEAFSTALRSTGERERNQAGHEIGERLHDLADELAAIRDGLKPTADDLARAPRLEGWKAEDRSTRVLTGRVFGHPDIPDGHRITTSDLWASDGDSFARTTSRYYALGTPAGGQRGRGMR